MVGLILIFHFGTFQLGDDAIDTPSKWLRECYSGESFLALANGQSITI